MRHTYTRREIQSALMQHAKWCVKKEARLHTEYGARRRYQPTSTSVNVDGGVAATPAGSDAALKRKRWLCANCRKPGQRSTANGRRRTRSDKQTSKQTVSKQTKQQTVRTVFAYPVMNKWVGKGVDDRQHKVVLPNKEQQQKVCYSIL